MFTALSLSRQNNYLTVFVFNRCWTFWICSTTTTVKRSHYWSGAGWRLSLPRRSGSPPFLLQAARSNRDYLWKACQETQRRRSQAGKVIIIFLYSKPFKFNVRKIILNIKTSFTQHFIDILTNYFKSVVTFIYVFVLNYLLVSVLYLFVILPCFRTKC